MRVRRVAHRAAPSSVSFACRRDPGQHYLRLLLSEGLSAILQNDALNFEIDPSKARCRTARIAGACCPALC